MNSGLHTGIGKNLNKSLIQWGAEPTTYRNLTAHSTSQELLNHLNPFHHQAMFPEVLWRENTKFNVVVGNLHGKNRKSCENMIFGLVIPSPGLVLKTIKERETGIVKVIRHRPICSTLKKNNPKQTPYDTRFRKPHPWNGFWPCLRLLQSILLEISPSLLQKGGRIGLCPEELSPRLGFPFVGRMFV